MSRVCTSELCSCGSGQYREEVYDARGIYVARVCDQCRAEKLQGYRLEIFTDSNYDTYGDAVDED